MLRKRRVPARGPRFSDVWWGWLISPPFANFLRLDRNGNDASVSSPWLPWPRGHNRRGPMAGPVGRAMGMEAKGPVVQGPRGHALWWDCGYSEPGRTGLQRIARRSCAIALRWPALLGGPRAGCTQKTEKPAKQGPDKERKETGMRGASHSGGGVSSRVGRLWVDAGKSSPNSPSEI